jgi:hypothetical protein
MVHFSPFAAVDAATAEPAVINPTKTEIPAHRAIVKAASAGLTVAITSAE